MKLLPSFFFIVLLALQANAQSLQRVAPEQVGMDSRHLLYADEAIETAIANKDIPGAVLAVVRNGKMAYLKAYGNKRVYPNTEPMTVNTIFDMASCSKPMSTAICTHILAERGKLRLLDPVSLYIPEFKSWVSAVPRRFPLSPLPHSLVQQYGRRRAGVQRGYLSFHGNAHQKIAILRRQAGHARPLGADDNGCRPL